MKKEYKQCNRCKSKQSKTSPPGFYKSIEVRNGVEYPIVKECLCHKNWRLETEAINNFVRNGFDPDMFDINLSNGDYVGVKSIGNITRLSKYIDNFFEDEKVRASLLFFYGPPDTQIKETVNWIGNKLIRKYEVHFVDFSTLFDKFIHSLWNPDGSKNADPEINYIIDKYSNCDLLIIGNFNINTNGKYTLYSDKQLGLFERFLKERILNNKGIIFCSLNSYTTLPNNLKDLISDKIKKRNTEFVFTDIVNDIPEELF